MSSTIVKTTASRPAVTNILPASDPFQTSMLAVGKAVKNTPLSMAQMVLIPILALTGLSIASYLAWHGFMASEVAGCSSSQVFDCSHVLNSRFSKIFGMPVGMMAVGTYAVIIVSWFLLITSKPSIQKLSGQAIWLAGVSAGSAAVWFISLQAFVLQHFCMYCLVAHTCSLCIAGLLLKRGQIVDSKMARRLAVVGFSGVLAVAMIQSFSSEKPTYKIEQYAATTIMTSTQSFSPLGEEGEEGDFNPLADVEPTETLFDPLATLESPLEEPSAEPAGASAATAGEELQARDEEPAAKKDKVAVESDTEPSRNSISNAFRFLLNPVSLVSGVIQDNGSAIKKNEAKSEAKPTAIKGRKVSILGGGVTLNTAQWPMVGSPTAKYILVEMFDYTCPHCRDTHPALNQVAKELGNEFAILAVPVPMSSQCNKTVTVDHAKHKEACALARLAIAVWRTSPEKFTEFHKWMLEQPNVPTEAAALAHANSLVPAKSLKTNLESKVPASFIQSTVKLYEKSGKGVIPKLMFPGTALVGKTESASMIKQMVLEKLGSQSQKPSKQ